MLTCLHALAYSISWDPTRVTGTVAYSLAALACIAAGLSNQKQRKTWVALSVVFVAVLADTLWNLRHEWSPFFSGLLSPERYAHRRPMQYALLIALGLVWGGVTFFIAYRLRRLGAVLGVVGGSLALACSGASLISYHHLDAITYARIGPRPLIAWLWMNASVLACAGAALTIFRAPKPKTPSTNKCEP